VQGGGRERKSRTGNHIQLNGALKLLPIKGNEQKQSTSVKPKEKKINFWHPRVTMLKKGHGTLSFYAGKTKIAMK